MQDGNGPPLLSGLDAGVVFSLLDTARTGLAAAEAERRLQESGRNRLPRADSVSLWRLLLRQLTHLMALLLWVAGVLAFMVDMPELGWATWFVIVVNALFSFWQEYRADKALLALAAMLPPKAKVIRDGRLTQVLSEEVVVGDVLVVEAGDHVPADARLIEAENMTADLSLLTGESMPAVCEADPVGEGDATARPANLLYAGTSVTAGRGVALVHATGKNTELGKITRFTSGMVREKSSLEAQVGIIVRLITLLALSMGAIVFLLAVWLLGIDLRASFIFCIGIIVANVPEGLLPTVSLSLAVGVRRMAGQNALVRKLSAVESLCATSVICTDKTGTITRNEVTVKRIWLPETEAEVSGIGYEKQGVLTLPDPAATKQLERLLTIGVVCSEAALETDPLNAKHWQVLGDPTEGALLVAAEKYGRTVSALRAGFDVVKTHPFDSRRRMMSASVVNRGSSLFGMGNSLAFVKGAPMETISCCRYLLGRQGIEEMTETDRRKIAHANDHLSNAGHRVLAYAYQEGGPADLPVERDLVFVGLAAMLDPPRPEAAEAFALCRQAGIRVTMITGDYGLTAAAVGRQTGLITDRVNVITGAELDGMDEDTLKEYLRQEVPVLFSRAAPEHKLRIVEAYKACGHVVAVTGDGVNDAPALKAADIGIAMGLGGTDVAREVADIVLLDDNFATIVKAIEQGRAIYDNIRKFMTYILASNIPELIPFVAMVFLRIPPALNILQILAIDIGTDMIPALALGAEPPEKGTLSRRPHEYTGNLLDRAVLLRAYGFLGMIEAALSMGAFFYVWVHAGYSLADMQQAAPQIAALVPSGPVDAVYRHATTMALAAIIACQIGNIFVCRSALWPFWQFSPQDNPLILAGIGAELSILCALIYLPPLAAVFLTRPLDWSDLFILVACPVVLVLMEEGRKSLSRRKAGTQRG